MTRRTGDITAAVIRWATNSPFSHAALIFTGPQFDSGISGTFVIESGTSGVDLTQFTDYTSNKSTFIAVKRLRQRYRELADAELAETVASSQDLEVERAALHAALRDMP